MASAVPLQGFEDSKFMWKVQRLAEFALHNLIGRLEGGELTELRSVIASEAVDRKNASDSETSRWWIKRLSRF
jgi:hypothetical protein